MFDINILRSIFYCCLCSFFLQQFASGHTARTVRLNLMRQANIPFLDEPSSSTKK